MATATQTHESSADTSPNVFQDELGRLLRRIRNVDHSAIDSLKSPISNCGVPIILAYYSQALLKAGKDAEAEALDHVRAKAIDKKAFGGLGLSLSDIQTDAQYQEVLFLVEAWLEAINSQEKANSYLAVRSVATTETRPMTLAQKIFAQHVVGQEPAQGLAAGDVVRVGIDWILASELSWAGMARTYKELGAPGIWRNDRFWLAGDHVVHPAVAQVPKVKEMVDIAEKAKKQFKMTEYQGMNYTIMHTEFVRERIEPGMLAIGSDSHTCSGGAVGSLAIGLGTADVMMALSLGETWFKIPESIYIEFVGQPSFHVSGKDVILHILGVLKRNTVAAERIVEFGGEGLQHLSIDARFAISNMCTEFGAITGVFVPDNVTRDYIAKRRRKVNRVNSLYFRPDQDAQFAGRYTIDLGKVESTVAVYPNPDDVVPVSQMVGKALDGVFIGACTTTEEELVLAALILKIGLERKLPLAKGKKHYVPGSLPIVEKLRDLGLLDVYENAGFTRGPPGCSYCVGLSAEKASEGETWLSSQNRNFQNRMGRGAFGHVTAAIVCAASSFSMSITDPVEYIKDLDVEFYKRYRQMPGQESAAIEYVEPDLSSATAQTLVSASDLDKSMTEEESAKRIGEISSKVVTLGDFIDTDALAPGSTLTTCVTEEEFGEHVLEHTHPDFRAQVRGGQQIVVAGNAFGVGSSREVAVSALKGVGVKAVIARSFAFIYGRNQPSLGLLGVTLTDEDFYAAAKDGEEITLDIPTRTVSVAGKSYKFQLSDMEYNLTINNGVAESFRKFGKELWERFTGAGKEEGEMSMVRAAIDGSGEEKKNQKLEW